MKGNRLDRELVARGLVSSRTKAQRHIQEGLVLVDGIVALKAAEEVEEDADITMLHVDQDVGQGAKKLRAALEQVPLPLTGVIAADLGASTGGFTQVLLESGASGVVSLDVGHGQLDSDLARDGRVINREGVNVAHLTARWWQDEELPSPVEVVVADLSFVSLTKIIPAIIATFGVHSHYLLLVKPQFEVGKGHTDQGVVKDARKREESVRVVADRMNETGVSVRLVLLSPVSGEKGNVEYFLYASASPSVYPAEWDGRIPRAE